MNRFSCTRRPRAPCPARRSADVFAMFVAACGVLSSPGANAGRPLMTDDASIVDAGACQLALYVERVRDGTTSWAVPACNPFGNLELSLGIAAARSHGDADRRLGSWQLKTVLREGDDEHAGFAASIANLRDPAQHDSAMGNTAITGIATVPLHPQALFHLNLGWLHERDDRDHSRRDRLRWGAALDAQVAAATRTSIEGFGNVGERPSVQLGALHQLVPGRLQIDASVGSQVGRARESGYFTLGLVLTTSAFLR